MTINVTDIFETKPTVILLTPFDSLGVSLANCLLGKGCQVKVFTKEEKRWQDLPVEVQSLPAKKNYPTGAYVLLNNYELEFSDKEITEFLISAQDRPVKVLVVLPYSVEEQTDISLRGRLVSLVSDFNSKAKIIFLGDVVDANFSQKPKTFLNKLFFFLIKKQTVLSFFQPIFVYPVSVNDSVKQIIKILFSFAVKTNQIGLISPPVLADNLLNQIGSRIGEKVLYKRVKIVRDSCNLSENLILQTDLDRLFSCQNNKVGGLSLVEEGPRRLPTNSPAQKLLARAPAVKERIKKMFSCKPKSESAQGWVTSRKLLFSFSILLIIVFSTPFFFLALGGTLALAGGKNLHNGKYAVAQKSFSLAESSTAISVNFFRGLILLPFIEKMLQPSLDSALILQGVADVGIRTTNLAEKSEFLVKEVLAGRDYDLPGLSNEIVLDLDLIYRQSGFLLGEITNQKSFTTSLITRFLPVVTLENLRSRLILAKSITASLPETLGVSKPKTYLILFQNNMELRPSGGFIGSFALIDFAKGKLTGVNVYDVYTADGQLRGHVEPPEPIKKYLDQATWFLRDANWDPDFAVSAQRIEWFLEKELDKSVDGTVAIDLAFTQKILDLTGPIELFDFNREITAKNLYEVTQAAVETNSFPGSTQKASFLTALAKGLMARVTDASFQNYRGLASAVFSALEARSLQIFVHDQTMQKAFTDLGFAGTLDISGCSGNCYNDFFGLVEANLGVNKANFFVQRSIALVVNLADGKIARTVTVNYRNRADPILGVSSEYKVWTRLILPSGAEVKTHNLVEGSTETAVDIVQEMVHGHQEVGFWLEVLPGQKKSVVFSWEEASDLDFSRTGKFHLNIRKQAGTEADPLLIRVSPAPNVKLTVPDLFTLTGDGSFVYNASLAKDVTTEFSWP